VAAAPLRRGQVPREGLASRRSRPA